MHCVSTTGDKGGSRSSNSSETRRTRSLAVSAAIGECVSSSSIPMISSAFVSSSPSKCARHPTSYKKRKKRERKKDGKQRNRKVNNTTKERKREAKTQCFRDEHFEDTHQLQMHGEMGCVALPHTLRRLATPLRAAQARVRGALVACRVRGAVRRAPRRR